MNTLPSSIPLILGIIAGALFVIIFAAATVITMRNRRIIRRLSMKKGTTLKPQD